MGIRTVEEYKESLRDGRRVYIRGEKVEDITKHPILGVACDTIAAGYELTASWQRRRIKKIGEIPISTITWSTICGDRKNTAPWTG